MGFDFLVPWCKRNPCCLNLPLQYTSDSMVYDPTAFIACKLVIVAWLIAYGAATKPRAPVEQLPHGDATRHALVSRLLTKHLSQVTPPYRFWYKIFFLKIFRCSNRKSTMGWWNSVLSSKTRGGSFGGRTYDMVWVTGKTDVVKEGKERRVVREVSHG